MLEDRARSEPRPSRDHQLQVKLLRVLQERSVRPVERRVQCHAVVQHHRLPWPLDPIDRFYRLGRVVAIGGMAQIHIADRRRDGRRVAIKLFQPGPGQVLRFRDYMEHEASALSVAANPLVVELLDFGMRARHPFLVLEWLDGLSLREVIAAESPPMSVRRVASIFGQLLDAIEALHTRGVVHADLKPDNVMLVPCPGGERVRLIDLGAAGVYGASAVRGDEVFGTPGYIAPEIAAGGALEPTADVYAAGVLLFELMTGMRLFPAATLGEAVERQTHGRIPRIADARLGAEVGSFRGLDAVLANALAPAPWRRYADVATLRPAFQNGLAPAAEPRNDGVPAESPDVPTARARRITLSRLAVS